MKLSVLTIITSLLITILMTAAHTPSVAGPQPITHEEIARDSIIFDLHCDTVYRFYRLGSMKPFLGNNLQVTLQRLVDSGAKAQFFAIWVPPSKGFKHADSLIRIFHHMLKKHGDVLAFGGSVRDLKRNIANGRISAFMGIESGRAIGNDIDNLDYFYKQGVRYMGLTWNYSNLIADAGADKHRTHGGLSDFGKRVVRRMNKLGMIVDISHASDEAVRDVLKTSSKPIIASHSCCWALRHYHRNLKDDLIEWICHDGGVIGVNFYTKHLSSTGYADVSTVVDHIDHVVQVGDIDCVAIGSDYDGMLYPAKGLEHIGKLENLTDELVRRGYTREQIAKIYGGNIIRVIRKVVGY